MLDMGELFSLLRWQRSALTDTLLSLTRALLPVLKGVMGVLPPLTEVPSPLAWVLPAAREGLAAMPRVASSLRLTEGSTAGEPHGGGKLLLVPGAVPAAEEEADSLKATASWRAYASQQQLCNCTVLMILTDMRGQEAATHLHLLLLVRRISQTHEICSQYLTFCFAVIRTEDWGPVLHSPPTGLPENMVP